MKHSVHSTNPAGGMSGEAESEGYFLASILLDVLETLRARGINAQAIGRALNLDMDSLLADPNGWVPIRLLETILRQALVLFPDPLMGLHASQSERDAAFGVLGYLAQTCATLQEVFTAKARYERLVSDMGTTTLRQEPGVVLCCWDCSARDPVFIRHATEFLLGQWLRHIHSIREQKEGLLLRVHFRHAAPEDPQLLKEYESIFACPVRFNQPESALVVPAPVMSLRLRSANPGLQATLERHAHLLLSERDSAPSLLSQIRSRLRVLLMEGSISRDHLAEELGISSRHLHRQLQKAGSSYRELVDDIRIELAKTLLQDNDLTVDAISRRLNFKEGPSFSRWFREMTKRTPGEYRRQLQAQER
ncbi:MULTISPECIES: AraC family transcriptional regulator [unclassified Pseudomonas]|uniref:AraC family transcriptional regulator n=1 Tax=unclassified Pseudomonas TaxID=196821 RepID=UPI00244C488C|nr:MULTISPECIES: AraC family transcriptional regulator [unclassified Pseudomonas]MDG9925813.1 AraC family transcriptional regulator [Pseudomonas sp. GD04045]MDH0037359.1 AraC family transcriptional regulator [Pseudomonas sp. GD04019]